MASASLTRWNAGARRSSGGSFGVDFARPSAPADAPRVPAAPAHAGEALKVGRDRPPGSPLMGSDASLGFRDLSLQGGYGFLCLAGRLGYFGVRIWDCCLGVVQIWVLLQLHTE